MSQCTGPSKVPAIQSEQEDLPVHLSTLRIGKFTGGIHQTPKTCRGLVKAERCQAACLLGWLADPCRVSRTGPAAFRDDHQATPEARMGHQLRPNTARTFSFWECTSTLNSSQWHPCRRCVWRSSQFINTGWPTQSSLLPIYTGCLTCWFWWQCWYVLEG